MSGKWLKLLLVFSICLNIGFVAVAGVGYYKHRNERREFPRTKKFSTSVIFDTVDLTTRQQEELEQLGDLIEVKMTEISKETSPIKIKVMKQLAAPKPVDKKKLAELSREIINTKSRRELVVHEHLLAVRNVLSDDQAQKVFMRFAEIQKKWSDKFKSPHR